MAEAKKPNILYIMADDIGITNLSCYSDGLMGYETPNIDRSESPVVGIDSYNLAGGMLPHCDGANKNEHHPQAHQRTTLMCLSIN